MDTQKEQQYKAALRNARETIRALQAQVAAHTEPVAVIGMSCLFPSGPLFGNDIESPEAFHQKLLSGVDAVVPVPPERQALWDMLARAQSQRESGAPRKEGLKEGAFLKRDIFTFDAGFFNLSPAESRMMDPHGRLLLELTYQALLDAGLDYKALRGSQTGVFAGKSNDDFLSEILGGDAHAASDPYTLTGNMHSTLPGRISHFFDWYGPSLAYETACSTSLVALVEAVESLRRGDCQIALVGSVNLMIGTEASFWLNAMHSLAPDGRCKAFGNKANGFGRGEGGGVVVLQRQSQAMQDHRRIHALVLGGATGSDGSGSGFTVPNSKAQRRVMELALKNARVTPDEVSYVEAHGTGTRLGDPVEVESLSQVYARTESKLFVGSVKSNLAHLEAAAGMAAFLKTVLSLKHATLYKSIHTEALNPLLDWAQLPVQVLQEQRHWECPAHGRRVAAVDSFSITGALAHVLLAEAPHVDPASGQKQGEEKAQPSDPPIGHPQGDASDAAPLETCVCTLSARRKADLMHWLEAVQEKERLAPDFRETCAASAFLPQEKFRLTLLAQTQEEFDQALLWAKEGKKKRHILTGEGDAPPMLWLFSGQGSQCPGMGRELYGLFPGFKHILDACDAQAKPVLGVSLLDILFAEADPRLNETRFTQAALYAHQAALVTLLQERGLTPSAVCGHSIGEYAAAYTAGILTLETGLSIVLERGRLVAGIQEEGSMAAVLASAERILPYLAEFTDVSIVAVNGADTVTLGGKRAQLVALVMRLQAEEGIENRPLPVSHAFHCPLVEPILPSYANFLQKQSFFAPRMPYLSCMTGQYLDKNTQWADYFVQQMRKPVDFYRALQNAREQVFVEIGAQSTLTAYGRQCKEGVWLFTQTAEKQQAAPAQNPVHVSGPVQTPAYTLAQTLARLYALGYPVTFQYQKGWRRGDALPVYPFSRERLFPLCHCPSAVAEEKTVMPDVSPASFEKETVISDDSGTDACAEKTIGTHHSAHMQIMQEQWDVFQKLCLAQQEALLRTLY